MKYLGTTEWICTKFTVKTCLVPCSDEFEGQGQKLKGQGSSGTKTAFFGPFSGLRAVCVLFGKTSLAVEAENFEIGPELGGISGYS